MIEPKDCWMKDECKKECGSFCLKLFKLDLLYNNALITMKQRKHIDLKLDASGIDKTAFIKLKDIENNIETKIQEGLNIFIHSERSGNGKTSWALRLMQAYFKAIWHKCELTCKGLFINVPRFLLELKSSITKESDYINHIKDNISTADLIIWDEIAYKQASEYDMEQLLSMINLRIDLGKSNIYTSNMDSDELKIKLGPRLYSRIVNYSIELEFFGNDKRNLEYADK